MSKPPKKSYILSEGRCAYCGEPVVGTRIWCTPCLERVKRMMGE
jgi:formylmethanofuran dehydrogenase subunit E